MTQEHQAEGTQGEQTEDVQYYYSINRYWTGPSSRTKRYPLGNVSAGVRLPGQPPEDHRRSAFRKSDGSYPGAASLALPDWSGAESLRLGLGLAKKGGGLLEGHVDLDRLLTVGHRASVPNSGSRKAALGKTLAYGLIQRFLFLLLRARSRVRFGGEDWLRSNIAFLPSSTKLISLCDGMLNENWVLPFILVTAKITSADNIHPNYYITTSWCTRHDLKHYYLEVIW